MININPKQISDKFDLHSIVSQIFHKRGYNKEWRIKQFLNPTLDNLSSPSLIPKIKEIGNKIKQYIEFGDKIIIESDFDTDGLSSATILYKSLNRLNANVDVIIGDRFKDGYGLSKRLIDEANKRNAELIITVDMGISEHENIKYAQSKGIEVIIFDHHESDVPPDCDFIDLKVEQGDYPFKYFSAAGLVWQICRYLTNDDLYDLLDIATLSTVGDLVPLYGENRVIVKEGLERLNNTNNIGLQELIKVNKLKNKIIGTGDVGFKLSPCINAIGRLYNNQKSFELLTTDDEDEAKKLAQELFKVNEKRKDIQQKGFESIKDKVTPEDNFIIGKGNFAKGVVGLIAQDLKEEYNKPSLIFGGSGDVLKGSGRGVKPLHILNEMKKFEGLFKNLGGHKSAFGCSIKENNYHELKEKILESTQGIEYETIKYDMRLDTKQITIPLVKQLDIFQPCGMGNPSPKFLIEGIPTNISYVGKNNNHLKCRINGIDCIGFDKAGKELSNKFIGSLNINKWNGQTKPQIVIRKILKEEV